MQDQSQTSNIGDGTLTALRSTVVLGKYQHGPIPSAGALVSFREQMYEGGIFFCGPTLVGSKMFRLDLDLVLQQLIHSSNLSDRGKTRDEMSRGVQPTPINFGASADGGKLIEHQGFILMVLRVTDREMLTNLGMLKDDWEGISSSVACVVMGFFEGSDNHDNNVTLCREFFISLQKYAAATSADEMFQIGELYYSLKIAIVLDKKELQLCSEIGGGTFVTKFPCTYIPVINTQLRDPAPYRCKQFCHHPVCF